MRLIYFLLYKLKIRFGWRLMSKTVDDNFGGTVNIIGKNSFECFSRTGKVVRKDSRSHKAMVQYKHPVKPCDGVTSYKFNFALKKYNEENPPSFLLIFQDWLRIDPDNKTGNRPITALVIKKVGDTLQLQHEDNSFQWLGKGEPKINGFTEIKKGNSYGIEIIIRDTGSVTVYVDDKKVSDAEYKTKSDLQWHTNSQMFGIYHTYGYDLEKRQDNKISLTIKNIEVSKWA